MTALNTWFKRIHFGKWTDRKDWQANVEIICQRWITHLPKQPVVDRRGSIFNENFQSWQYAGLLFGLEESFAYSFLAGHTKILDMPSVDKALLMYVLYKKNQLTKEALLDFARPLMTGDIHTIPYRNDLPDIRFVDALGMLVPLMVACGMNAVALAQLHEFDPALLKGVFPPHAYDIKRGLPMGIYDWGRGLGWYILALTESTSLEESRARIVQLAETMMHFRLPNGGLGAHFFSPSRLESSGTALLGILFMNAFDLTGKQLFLDAALQAEQALMRITRRDGAIDYGQGDTVDISNYSRRFDILPFTQGIALFLSKELDLRLR